jgi:chemotaxis protein histidine kinase CheA
VANINAGARPSLVTRLIHNWELEPAEARLIRLGDYARALAGRLGKSPLQIEHEAHDVRLHPADWLGFWQAMVHVVRNAVDHGLEGADARRAAGKAEAGRLKLQTRLADGRLQLRVEDDGAGIDWARVAEAAQKRGLPTATHQQLVAAVLADGTSTRDEATHTSGRGLGLSAVREACAAVGGTIAIDSEPGRGTAFVFSVPVDALGRPASATITPQASRAAHS